MDRMSPLDLLADHLLSAVVFLPLASLLPLLLLEALLIRLPVGFWRAYAFIASLAGLALSLGAWARFDPGQGGMQLVEHAPWIRGYGITYYLGVDGISLLLVVLTAFLLPVILLAAWNDIQQRVKQFVCFMMLLQTGMLGAFLALNLFLFYVFWEAMLIPMYFVIGIWGGPRRIYATLKFFIYTMVGSLLMLVGILVLAYLHFEQTGWLSFDYVAFQGGPAVEATLIPTDGAWWKTQSWLFAAFALAFAIKVPMFPFHTWLPDAHVEAPTAGSAVLAGVLLKLGTYGFVRYAIPLFPVATIELAPAMVALSLIGIVYGALVAMVQQDVKKLVAYSSVSHLGFVMLGLFALNLAGLEGAVLQMVNHGVSTGALFILVGMLYERRHTRDIAAFGGLARTMPVFASFFLIATLSSIGLPLLGGFVGEFLILLGAFGREPIWGALGALGVILSAVYMLRTVRRVFFGPLVHEVNRRLEDLSLREVVVATALVAPMVWVGIYPMALLRPLGQSLEQLMQTVEARGVSLERYRAEGGRPALLAREPGRER
jgi:NADH-quinone oxidoreductase subunit M